jgi:phosphate transport system substrate-binding protein
MKKQLILMVTLALASGVVFGQKVKGSDTVLPLAQKEAESYMKKNASSKVSVTGGGSGVGLAALIDGSTDIAMASRKMKMDEKLKLKDAGRTATEEIIAYDALTVIVNPGNKVTQLTREQLEDIFTGKTKNWKEVGGDDMAIVVYSRESSSGTYEFFKEHVMNKKNFAASVLSMPATGSIVQSVSQTKGAIGYIGMAYLEKTVKAVKVSFDKGKTYYEPTMANAKSKVYPITRPLYMYYLSTAATTAKPFIQYIQSTEGQAIVEKEGYVGLK